MIIGHLATFVICVTAVVLCSIACAGDDWIEVTGPGGDKATFGLWKNCSTINGVTGCESFSVDVGFYNACRAMTVIAVIIAGVSALGYIVAWLAPDDSIFAYGGEPYISSGLLILTGTHKRFTYLLGLM